MTLLICVGSIKLQSGVVLREYVCTVISELLCCASVSESKLRGKSSSRRGPRGHGRGQYPRKDTKVSLIAIVDILSDVLLVSHLVLLLLNFQFLFNWPCFPLSLLKNFWSNFVGHQLLLS